MLPLIGVATAAALALAIAACTATILRRLPPPPDEPDARPYAELISRRLILTVLGVSFTALVLPFLLLDWSIWPVWAVLGTVGVLLAVIDAHTGLLPLRLTWTFSGLTLAATAASAWLAGDVTIIAIGLLCSAGAGGLFWLLWRIGGGLGFGDVRLAVGLGLAAGANSLQLAVWSFLLGGLAGVVWGLVVRLRRGAGAFPYGPSLVLGPYLGLVYHWGLGLIPVG